MTRRKKHRRIYVICAVRVCEPDQTAFVRDYVAQLEAAGHEVYLPGRDTGIAELPENGWGIVQRNEERLRWADEVHIVYSRTSQGSAYDLGFARALHKPIVIAQRAIVRALAKGSDGFAVAMLEMEKEK